MNSYRIKVYGTKWCGDTRRALRFLDLNFISYLYIDIDEDQEARKLVEEVNNGYRSVPTIIFPDGSMLVEPTEDQLALKFGLDKA